MGGGWEGSSPLPFWRKLLSVAVSCPPTSGGCWLRVATPHLDHGGSAVGSAAPPCRSCMMHASPRVSLARLPTVRQPPKARGLARHGEIAPRVHVCACAPLSLWLARGTFRHMCASHPTADPAWIRSCVVCTHASCGHRADHCAMASLHSSLVQRFGDVPRSLPPNSVLCFLRAHVCVSGGWALPCEPLGGQA